MADANTWSQIIAVASGSSLVSTFVAQFLITRRERAHKRTEAGERREQRWAEFQMKMLVDLQNTNERLVRAARAIAHEMKDVLGDEKAGDKFHQLLHDCTDSDYHIVNVMMLIDDEDVRSVTNELRIAAAELAQVHLKHDGQGEKSVSWKARRELSQTMGEKFNESSEIIGRAVRKLR